MKSPLIAAAAAALMAAAPLSHATVIESAYTPLGQNAWRVDFTVRNDGTPASFAGFSIEFPNAANLVLIASPAAWDSTVFQPDANLPDDGYLDSFLVNAANPLPGGQSIGGFAVSFTRAAGGAPGPLPFTVWSGTFAPLFVASTTVTAVPEPAAALMAALGLAVVGLRVGRAQSGSRNETARGVTA